MKSSTGTFYQYSLNEEQLMSCVKLAGQKDLKTNKNSIKQLSLKALQEKLESKSTRGRDIPHIQREIQLRTKLTVKK